MFGGLIKSNKEQKDRAGSGGGGWVAGMDGQTDERTISHQWHAIQIR